MRSPDGAQAKSGAIPSASRFPDCAEFILGHAEGVTRGLHPGYRCFQPWSDAASTIIPARALVLTHHPGM